MRKRVERAKELLRPPDATLAEIALVCGFVDQSHLTRVFSRAEKMGSDTTLGTASERCLSCRRP
jgi:transcriptional regulator GlxA family with amidase domain